MTKQTKIILGLSVVAIAYYLWKKNKDKQVVTQNKPSEIIKENSIPTSPNNEGNYVDYIIPSGKIFKDARLGTLFASFGDEKRGQYDSGNRSAKSGEYKVLKITKDGVPFGQFQKKIKMDGFEFYDGAIGDIVLTKDVKGTYQNKQIIMT